MSAANESAYPTGGDTHTGNWAIDGGLTKRERFAMAAMQGLVSSITMGRDDATIFVAETAVRYADALLNALAKGES
jgi:hypothetical protein